MIAPLLCAQAVNFAESTESPDKHNHAGLEPRGRITQGVIGPGWRDCEWRHGVSKKWALLVFGLSCGLAVCSLIFYDRKVLAALGFCFYDVQTCVSLTLAC